jgi:hypothetical protein
LRHATSTSLGLFLTVEHCSKMSPNWLGVI